MESILQSAEQIEKLKKEKDVAILAHYYTDGPIQSLADYVGDSYYLCTIAENIPQKNILFCGVAFMGESLKILHPEKTVIMADKYADCPLAHMADVSRVKQVRQKYPDAAVVCYINSTAELKACSDVCVTSSNAVKIVRALPNRHIFFVPDKNLGRYVAGRVPEKEFILNDGYCPVHEGIAPEDVEGAKKLHPKAAVVAHPECRAEVLKKADYVGSTSGILDYVEKSNRGSFIVCTELGVLYPLKMKNPGKKFYPAGRSQFCPNMKRITVKGPWNS